MARQLKGTRTAGGGSGTTTFILNKSRASGVAPLAVQFDTIGTTSSLTARPWHDREYKWGFGEVSGPGIATWGAGSRSGVASKNVALGPNAAHMFETPGTYTITVTDTADGTSATTQVVVDDPDVVFASTTAVLSTNSTFTGSPTGTQYPNVTDLSSTIATAIAAGSRRIRLQKGQTFSTSTVVGISVAGPGLIDSFGSGAIPVIQPTSGFPTDTPVFGVSGSGTPTMKDWRIIDHNFDFSLIAVPSQSAVRLLGGVDQMTILRCTTNFCRISFYASEDDLTFWNANGHPGHHIWDNLAVVDCTIANVPKNLPSSGPVSSYGTYLSQERGFFAGNNFNLSAAPGDRISHVSRFPYQWNSVISNNTLLNPGGSEHCIKMHAPTQGSGNVALSASGGGYTAKVTVSDNYLNSDQNDYQVAIGPQTPTTYDERVKDVIYERNYNKWTTHLSVGLVLWCQETTVRNNVFDMVGGSTWRGIIIGQRGIEPVPNNNHVYNNTFYTSDATNDFVGCQVDAVATNTVIQNNHAEARSATGPVVFSGSATNDHNTLNGGAGSPFVGPLTSLAGFKINGGTAPIGAGTHNVPVYFDAFEKLRAAANAVDTGVHQFT